MYWDWETEWAAPSKSSVWDPVTGFGGNGSDTTNNGGRPRVENGPFRNLRPTYWGQVVDPHWLSRDWSPAIPEANLPEMIGIGYGPQIMQEVRGYTEFQPFWGGLESSPHGAVHGGVGGGRGDMGPGSSPNGMLSVVFFFASFHFPSLFFLLSQSFSMVRGMRILEIC